MLHDRKSFCWIVFSLVVTLFTSHTSAANQRDARSRRLDAFAAPGRWVTSELNARQATDTLADGRPTLHIQIDVDHTRPENVPIGWPRMYLQLEPEEKNWDKYDRFEFLLLGRTDRPTDSGLPAVFHVMCPDKENGVGVAIRLPKPNSWTRVSIPINSIGSLDRLGALHFYIGEKRYEHGERVEFLMGGFRLTRNNNESANGEVQITTLDTYILDDLEMVHEWAVRQEGARLEPADSAAVGTGAMRGHFPGSLRKKLRARPLKDLLAWERCQGVSFWAKGNGSDQFGCISLQGWSSRLSYVYHFPLKHTEWRQFTVPWYDFVPQGQYEPIGSPGGLPPGGGFDSVTLGDRWTLYHNNKPIPAHSYAIDHLQVERRVEQPGPVPALRPIEDVLQRLRERKQFHIVCIGDSITAGAGLADPDNRRYAVRLQALLRSRLQYDEVSVESRGVGGARTTDARAWVDRDLNGTPPDLVIIQFGYNDKKLFSCDYFQRSLDDYIDRVARKTNGKTAILLLTTLPGTGPAFSLLDDFAEAVRELGEQRQVTVYDLHRTMKQAGTRAEIESTYYADMAHPNEAGHELIASSIADLLYKSETALRIDFGTDKSPVRKGFVRVTGETGWAEGTKVGWLNAASIHDFSHPIPRGPAQPVIFTNDWREDGVQGDGPATLRIDMPKGKYRIWAIGGPAFGVPAQVWNAQLRNGGASAEATWCGKYSCRTMTLDVESDEPGKLDLTIDTRSRWALNALIIASHREWHEDTVKEIAAMERHAFFLPEDVLAQWKHQPRVVNERPSPEFSDTVHARGFAIHQRNWVAPVWPDSHPSRDASELQLETFAAPGQYEPLTFTLLPLRDLRRVTVNVSDLRSDEGRVLPTSDIDIRYVQYKWVRPNYNVRGRYYRAPDLLPRFVEPRDLRARENFRVWLTLHVRLDATPGRYHGTVQVNLDRKPSAKLPIRVRVLPITLERDPELVNGTYYRPPVNHIDKAPDAYSRTWWSRKMRCDFASMGQHGYNSFVARVVAGPAENGNWITSVGELETLLNVAQSHGFDRLKPVVCYFNYSLLKRYRYYTGHELRKHLVGVRMPPREFFDEVSQIVRALESERKRRGLAEFVYYPIDEPATTPASIEFTTAVLKAIKQVPGVRTYVTADPTEPRFAPLKPFVDVWCCHYFALSQDQRDKQLREQGVEHWCYPNQVAGENDHTPVGGARMTYGFGRWRLGYSVLIPWTFEAHSGAPENYLDGYSMDFFNKTADDGSVLPCTLYEAYRQGIDDGRYITTLERWIERARKRGFDQHARQAQQALASIRNSISVNRENYRQLEAWGWTDVQLNQNRRALAEQILALQELR